MKEDEFVLKALGAINRRSHTEIRDLSFGSLTQCLPLSRWLACDPIGKAEGGGQSRGPGDISMFLGKCDISVCSLCQDRVWCSWVQGSSHSFCHHRLKVTLTPWSSSRHWDKPPGALSLAGKAEHRCHPPHGPARWPSIWSAAQISATIAWMLTVCWAHSRCFARVSLFLLPNHHTREL